MPCLSVCLSGCRRWQIRMYLTDRPLFDVWQERSHQLNKIIGIAPINKSLCFLCLLYLWFCFVSCVLIVVTSVWCRFWTIQRWFMEWLFWCRFTERCLLFFVTFLFYLMITAIVVRQCIMGHTTDIATATDKTSWHFDKNCARLYKHAWQRIICYRKGICHSLTYGTVDRWTAYNVVTMKQTATFAGIGNRWITDACLLYICFIKTIWRISRQFDRENKRQKSCVNLMYARQL